MSLGGGQAPLGAGPGNYNNNYSGTVLHLTACCRILLPFFTEELTFDENMKIEEMLPHDFVKVHRKNLSAKLPGRTAAKKVLLVIAAGVMCIGSYHFGYESNQSSVKRYVQ